MRRITADFVYPIHTDPVPEGVVVVEDDGTIIDVVSRAEAGSDLERVDGILCPGFVNAHCHLELSHLKGKVEEGTGLPGFITRLMAVRRMERPEIVAALEAGEAEMIAEGIVAVGDISNDDVSFAQKAKGNLHYHTFIELFGQDPNRADAVFERGQGLMSAYAEQLRKSGLEPHVSVTPHAPYSMSKPLLKHIGSTCYVDGSPMSIHNQETEGETEMFLHGTGDLVEALKTLGFDPTNWNVPGFRSLAATANYLPNCNRFLFVHNTFSERQDIQWANDYSPVVSWCLCPRANLYIENRLPDVQLFRDMQAHLVVGTDSLASNHSLSILEELKVLATHFPGIPLTELLQWATLNGAEVLSMKKSLGSFEKGKTPGINAITGVEGAFDRLGEHSRVRKIL